MWGKTHCVYHSDDTYGPTYDSWGHICPALSWDDKLALIIGLGLCGLVLLSILSLYLLRRHRKTSKHKADDMSQPLITAPAMAPIIVSSIPPPQPQPQPQSDQADPFTTRRASDDPTQFHFPILSADGELLLPLPPRTSSARPLPSPPTPELQTPVFEYDNVRLQYPSNPDVGFSQPIEKSNGLGDYEAQTRGLFAPSSEGHDRALSPLSRYSNESSYVG